MCSPVSWRKKQGETVPWLHHHYSLDLDCTDSHELGEFSDAKIPGTIRSIARVPCGCCLIATLLQIYYRSIMLKIVVKHTRNNYVGLKMSK